MGLPVDFLDVGIYDLVACLEDSSQNNATSLPFFGGKPAPANGCSAIFYILMMILNFCERIKLLQNCANARMLGYCHCEHSEAVSQPARRSPRSQRALPRDDNECHRGTTYLS